MSSELLGQDAIEAMVRRCREVFGNGWTQSEALALHGRIEMLCDAAEAAGRSALAETLLELSVFVCSLVEAEAAPPESSQARLAAIGERVVDAGRPAPMARERAGQAAARRNPRVVLLTEPAAPRLELSAELGRRQILVDRAEHLSELGPLLERRPAELVVLTPAWLDQVAEVLRCIERSSHNRLDQPGTLCLLGSQERGQRLHALRAGVEKVIEDGSAEVVAEAAQQFLHSRRRAAFRVLVVEDDRAQAMFAQSVLAYRGIECEWASSAEQALERCSSYRPDLILLDLHLPDRNGIEVAQLLRERPGFDLVQIVFLSGESDLDQQVRAIRLGADDWISKPVRPRHLLSVVESRAERAQRIRARAAHESEWTSRAGVLSRRGFCEELEQAWLAKELPDAPAVWLLGWRPAPLPGHPDGVGFVAQDDLQRELGQTLLHELQPRGGLCPIDGGGWLAAVDARQAEPAVLQRLLQELERRRWLSHAQPLQIRMACAGLQLAAEFPAVDAAIHELLGMLQQAAAEPPRLRLRASDASEALPAAWVELAAASADGRLGEHVRLGYLPLLPVRGRVAGQYELQPEWALADGRRISHAEMLGWAQRYGQLEAVEQAVVAAAIGQLQAAQQAATELGLSLVLSATTAQSERFHVWLRAELRRRQLSAPQLSFWLDAEPWRGASARAARVLGALGDLGVRVGLGLLGDLAVDLELARLAEVQVLWCEPEAQQVGPTVLPDALVGLAYDYGKTLVVRGVDRQTLLPALYAGQAHYLVGAAVCPPLERPEFEFPET